MMRTTSWVVRLLLGPALVASTAAASGDARASDDFVLFESGQVRPLALSHDGKRLYAVNTPDNRLEIFRVKRHGIEHEASVAVGLEPVAVAVHGKDEVWVVNHLSDSISIVDVKGKPRVARTLQVGDEPRDVVFAGPGRDRAFVTVAHRGQNAPFDPEIGTPGIGRADVWVYDADDLGPGLDGDPIAIVNLFTDTPRALAVTPDGTRVYAAGFNTGNQTTVITEFIGPPLPPPTTNVQGIEQPQTGLIVKYDGQHWVDELGRPWDPLVNFHLPDEDVFVIDAMADPPAEIPGTAFTGVGTTLYGMAVNPVNGKVYVSNTEAFNEQRFEGPGELAGHTVRGRFAQNRITVLDALGAHPRHLNKHLDDAIAVDDPGSAESLLSVSLPTGMVTSSDGSTLYAAMLGTSEIGIYDTAALEDDSFEPDEGAQVQLSGGGPTGLVLDEDRGVLYVLTRFDNAISVVDLDCGEEVDHVPMFNPEPESVVVGRRFMYDATLSSGGDSSCATCHVFGDKDELAWDLGNPDAAMLANGNPMTDFQLTPLPLDPSHPALKGPLTTQSLRGMDNHGPMHWRGDRSGGRLEESVQPDDGAYDEREAFRQFQDAFVDLVGRPDELPHDDMEAFTDFVLAMMYPPNPIRNLDDSLTPDQAAGRDFFMNRVSEAGAVTCATCHTLDPDGNREHGVAHPGFFGTEGKSAREVFPQIFKVPHLRNLYTKVGMFGFNDLAPLVETIPDQIGPMGDQIRGFGFSRAGDLDSVFRFLHATQFSTGFIFGPNPGGFPAGPAGATERRQVEAFLMAFDTNHKPIVGQQVTLTKDASAATRARVDLLLARAQAGDCDLVARGHVEGNRERGFLHVGGGMFRSDHEGAPLLGAAQLRAKVRGKKDGLTFTCAPIGTGYRFALDRDRDGDLDAHDHDHD